MLTPTNIAIAAAIIVVVVLFVFLARSRARRVPRRPADPYVDALSLLVDGQSEAAYRHLQDAVRTGRAPTDAYIRLGKLLRERGDAAKALQIHKSLTVKPDLTRREKVRLFVNIANDYSALGKPDQAIAVLETASKRLSLREPEVVTMLAKESHVLGRIEEAYGYLKELKKLGSIGERELSLYLASAGEQRADDGDLKEARKYFQRALKHDPENATALLALGNLEEKQDAQDGAVNHWKRAALVSPDVSSHALANLERVMFQRGTFREIERVYREVLEARPWDEYATMALASFYRKQGRGEEAIGFLEEFHSMHPESLGTTLLLTSLYAAHRDGEVLQKFLDDNEAILARRSKHVCEVCEFQSDTMRWHCPRCNSFDSFSRKNGV